MPDKQTARRNRVIHGVIFILIIVVAVTIRHFYGWPVFFVFIAGAFFGIIQSGAFTLVLEDWEKETK